MSALALRFFSFALVLTLAVLPPLATGADRAAVSNAPRETLKVLHVGNSFSNNAARYLRQIAKSGGKDLLLAGATISGCSLERHARHLKEAKAGDTKGRAYTSIRHLGLPADQQSFALVEALEARDWDVVTIQQASASSFRPETYEPYAGQLISEIRERAPNATVLIHQTWAYRPDHLLLKRENITSDTMHERIVDAYTQLGNRYHLGFLPSGNAVYAASNTDEWAYALDADYDYENPADGVNPQEKGLYPGNRWLNRNGKPSFELDASHMNTAGDYLAGCVWYEILFNDSVLDVKYFPKGITSEQAESLRRIAHETVAAYREKGEL